MGRSIQHLYHSARIDTLVENRLRFNTDNVELNLFETKEKAFEFRLEFSDLSLITMFEGKKVMQLGAFESFDFMPSESLILDKYAAMKIDFPEAELNNPTRCMALIISEDEIRNTLSLLNDTRQRYNNNGWEIAASNLKFQNDYILELSINKIIQLASSEHPHRKVLSKLATQELIVNLMQTQAKNILLRQTEQHINDNPLAFAIQHIKDNIENNIDLKEVAQKAYMSKSTFFRHFKNETGITPSEFVLNEKIKMAKKLLKNEHHSITDIALSLSFGSASHFIQLFKKLTGETPNAYRKQLRA